jgi:hypothetical protein
LGAENVPVDADFQTVGDAWPVLTETLKAGILGMIEAARK